MCCPYVNLYGPIHGTYLAFWIALNLYMHCGYYIPIIENTLPLLYIDTSEWHNLHHNLKTVHFGEMLILWDLIMGTHTKGWSKDRLDESEKTAVKDSNEHRGVRQVKSE